MKMKPLPERFTLDGFDFRQLIRSGAVALFEKRKPGRKLAVWEVVIVQKREAGSIEGKSYPAREVMPSPSDWGDAAWSFSDLARARQKFSELVQLRDQPRQSAVSTPTLCP